MVSPERARAARTSSSPIANSAGPLRSGFRLEHCRRGIHAPTSADDFSTRLCLWMQQNKTLMHYFLPKSSMLQTDILKNWVPIAMGCELS